VLLFIISLYKDDAYFSSKLIKRQIMQTLFEDLPVELIYNIFLYFDYYEIWNIFSDLNSRFTGMIDNISFMPVYLGFNGMSIELTEFYYKYLSQPNVFNSLISLCVSDKFAFDNGLWLSSHLSQFINLRHLSLFDIKRSTFELILNLLSPMNSLKRFSVNFSETDRAYYTFCGVPEGVYYERIFRLFPSLHVCHLLLRRFMRDTIDSEFVLPSDKPFLPIQTYLPKLKSLTIECSIYFLSHLIEHLPQLEQLNYKHTDLWLPQEHLLRNDNNL
jgi:hypothetical protein